MALPALARASERILQILIGLAFFCMVAGLCSVGVQWYREAAARSQTQCKLKMMCLGIHGKVSPSDDPMPPSMGRYPVNGPRGSLFFHILPYLECDRIYADYKNNYDALETEVVTYKIFCAPTDPTNPGKNTTLTSYASNTAVFGFTDGGSTRLSKMREGLGSSNAILFMERYAVVGSAGTRHTWPGLGERDNYLYSPDDSLDPAKIGSPQFDKAADDACNKVPHAFNRVCLSVGMADGSARSSDYARRDTHVHLWRRQNGDRLGLGVQLRRTAGESARAGGMVGE